MARFPILMYHRIDTVNPKSTTPGHYVSPSLFRKHMTAMKRLGYRAIPLHEAVSTWSRGEQTPPKTFAITFDDGCRNVHTNARPILSEFGFPSTTFLVTDLIGKTNAWNEVEGDVVEPLMDVDHIRECGEAGMDFGSHTLTHCNLKTLDATTAKQEIEKSKADIEAMLGTECSLFCYPYGAWRPETREMVIAAGYSSACSTAKGGNDAQTDRFLLKRLNIRSDSSLPVFLYKLFRGVVLDR